MDGQAGWGLLVYFWGIPGGVLGFGILKITTNLVKLY